MAFNISLYLISFPRFQQNRLTFDIGKMCGGSYGKRPRSVGDDRSSDEPVKSPRVAVWVVLERDCSLTWSDLNSPRKPRRDLKGCDVHDGVDVVVDRRDVGVRCRGSAV